MNAIKSIVNFIFPSVCHICGKNLHGSEEFICTPCQSALPRTLYHRRPDNPMEQRFAGLFPFEHASGHFFYSPQSELATIIHDFKYNGFKRLARHMGRLMGRELLTTGFLSDIDVIVPVPMHFYKQARRGYNQSEQLALGLGDITSIPVDTTLRATRPHRTQTRLSHKERLDNISGIFSVRGNSLEHSHILLVDDVCTTGATLTEAASTLHSSLSDIRISILTLGVTF